jgi:hypothetical protein
MLSKSIQEQLAILKGLQSTLLPSEAFTVDQLLAFHLLVQRMSTVFTHPDQYLSSSPINCFQFDEQAFPDLLPQ